MTHTKGPWLIQGTTVTNCLDWGCSRSGKQAALEKSLSAINKAKGNTQ